MNRSNTMKNSILCRTITIVFFIYFATAGFANATEDIDCQNDPSIVCIVSETGLPLRVLVKPQSNIYFDKDESSPQFRSNIPAFEVFYAFELEDVSYDDNFKPKFQRYS